MSSNISGDIVGGDRITAGDISHSIAAIGAGAQVIVKKALSAAEEARAQQKLEREKLAEAVVRLVNHLIEQINAPVSATGNPYKNLLPYEVADASRFFGRERDVDELRDRTDCDDSRCRFAVLHGEAGSGKTSILQAGLIPLLVADQHLPLYLRIGVSDKPPDEQIKRALLPNLELTPKLKQMSLRAFLHQIIELLPEKKRVFLFLDHFGIFFDTDPALREKFVKELGTCLADDALRTHWLISIRSTKLGHLNIFQSVTSPFANNKVLAPLVREEARPLITAPALLRGIDYQPALLETLLDDLGGDQIDLSRLQLVCDALYQASTNDTSTFQLKTYKQLGGVEGILTRFLDQTLERNFPVELRQTAWRALAVIANQPANTISEDDLYNVLGDYDVTPVEARRALHLLSSNRLVQPIDLPGYHLTGEQFKPRIQQWMAQRTASEEARAETRRQLERVRNSALRGLLGGAVGFALAFFSMYAAQTSNSELLAYITAFRTVPGALAGLLLVLLVDVAIASYHGPRRWLRWLTSALAGGAAFSLMLLFHRLLRLGDTRELLLAAAEGALWGMVTGLGAVWLLDKDRSFMATISLSFAVSLLAGFLLLPFERLARTFESPTSPLLIVLAGFLMPFCVLAVALWPRLAKESVP